MQVTCDNCGKIYRVDENKIKGEKARLKCRSCANVIIVTKPHPGPGPRREMPPPEPPVLQKKKKTVAAPQQMPPEESRPPVQETETAPGRRKVRFGLFFKICIVMLIVSLLPLIIFWSITYKESVSRIHSDTELLFKLTAQELGNTVENWIENNVWVLKAAAEQPAIQSMNRRTQESVLREIQRENPHMYLVFTVGLDGRNVARSDDVPLKDYSDRQYYKDIIQGRSLSWQNLIGKTSKKPALVLAVPIRRDNRLIGVMAGAMTREDLSQAIVRWRRGKTGFAFLIDEKGRVVAHQDESLVITKKNLNTHPLIKSYKSGRWTTHATTFVNDNGHPSYGHVKTLKRGWAIAIQQENAEVFATLEKVRNFAIILLISTIVIVSLIAWISARAIVTPIMKLTDVAERMSLGDLNMQINIPSKDEIGLLAQAIKRMQTSLRLAMERLRRKR